LDNTVLTLNQELAHKHVQNHALDIKATKCMVLRSKHVPKFPDSEWNNILMEKAVNLDAIFSGMYSMVMDNWAIENISNLKLHFRATKPAKVETHGEVIAWMSTKLCTSFSHIVKLNSMNITTAYIVLCINPSKHAHKDP